MLLVYNSLFMIGAIVLFRKFRNFAQRLILWLTIAAALDTIPYFMVRCAIWLLYSSAVVGYRDRLVLNANA